MNESGLIWAGAHNDMFIWPWNFAQVSPIHDQVNEPQLPWLQTAIHHTGLDVETESHPVHMYGLAHQSRGVDRGQNYSIL